MAGYGVQHGIAIPRTMSLSALSHTLPSASLVPAQIKDSLARLLRELCERSQGNNSNKPLATGADLRDFVESESRDLSGENLSRFLNDLYARIQHLVNSHEPADRLGAVAAIDALIDMKVGERAQKITHFGGYLRELFNSSSDPAISLAASKALGHLARVGGALAADIVESEVRRALEWLRADKAEHRLYLAVLILRELAANAPTVFNVHVPALIEHIWCALRDDKLYVREAAVAALRECLCVIEKRETRYRVQWYYRMFEETQKGLSRTLSNEVIHGSLLTIGELLRYTGEFMLARYKEVVETILKFRDHRDKQIRRSVTVLISRVAHFSPERFTSSYLQVCMKHLLKTLQNVPERGVGFETLGEMSSAVGGALTPYIPAVEHQIKDAITPKRGKPICWEALACLGQMTEAVGEPMQAPVEGMLDIMFKCPLSPTLVETLTKISTRLPVLLPPIQDRLLDTISLILAKCPYQMVFASAKGIQRKGDYGAFNGGASIRPSSPSYAKDGSSGALAPFGTPGQALERIQLALHTLGAFDFKGHSQLEFVREVVLPYLDESDAGIRKQAALACCLLLESCAAEERQQTPAFAGKPGATSGPQGPGGPPPPQGQALALTAPGGGGSGNGALTPVLAPSVDRARLLGVKQRRLMEDEIISKLLELAVADADAEVRQQVLQALKSGVGFDEHLVQAESLRALFFALNDESFMVRKLVMATIGRLAERNPAYVLPALRHHLLQLLTDLEHSAESKNKEESAILIGCLIIACKRLFLPYVQPVLKSLIAKLREGRNRDVAGTQAAGQEAPPAPIVGVRSGGSGGGQMAACVLDTIGKLAKVAGSSMQAYLPDLFPIMLDFLREGNVGDHSDVVVDTMGRFVQSTGYVIAPYLDYPSLLTMLLRLLSGEMPWETRREVIKVLGVIGALDPLTHKRNQLGGTNAHLNDVATPPAHPGGANDNEADSDSADSILPGGFAAQGEDYYPMCNARCTQVAINALMRNLKDSSLSSNHLIVVKSLMYIFKAVGLGCVPYLPKVMPTLFSVMHTCEDDLRDFLFQQLAYLVSIVCQHIRPYLTDIFRLVYEYWCNGPLLLKILKLLEELSLALNDEFRVYLPELLPRCVGVLSDAERSGDYSNVTHILRAFESFGGNMDEHVHIILPALVRLFNPSSVCDQPLELSKYAIASLAKLLPRMQFTGYASGVVHPLARVLRSHHVALHDHAMDAICVLAISLGQDFLIFVPMIKKLLAQHKKTHPRFEAIAERLQRGEPAFPVDPVRGIIPDEFTNGAVGGAGADSGFAHERAPLADTVALKMPVHEANLKKAWESSQRSTKEDWLEWMRHFSVELLRESPSPALRACHQLAVGQPQIARELFAAGFVICWAELPENYQEQLVQSLEAAFASPTIPPEVVATLLNLAEFMEHDERPLPVDIRTLGALAEKCHAFAKALHYKEAQFEQSPTGCIEALISINNNLHQPEAAVGVLVYAQQHLKAELKESWYEKLQRWDEALDAYERKCAAATTVVQQLEANLGRMRCLSALAEWEKLRLLSQDVWLKAEPAVRLQMAPMAASAAWNMGQWDEMATYVSVLDVEGLSSTQASMGHVAVGGFSSSSSNRSNGCFYNAVLCVKHGKYKRARGFIEKARELIGVELAALVGESYERAYGDMVRVQQLTELEEVIDYKTLPGDEEGNARRTLMKRMWHDRIRGAQRNVEVWQALLAVRSLVMPALEDCDTWLKFSSLCRRSGRVRQSRDTLVKLLQYDPKSQPPPPHVVASRFESCTHARVMLAYLKHEWSDGTGGSRPDAYRRLQQLVGELEADKKVTLASCGDGSGAAGRVRSSEPQLLAHMYLKLGTWRWSLADNLDEATIQDVLNSLRAGTEADRTWAKVWHHWALFNVAAMDHYARSNPNVAARYVAPAVAGFFRSIALGTANQQRRDGCLQDILRLLTLWFTHGSTADVQAALQEGFGHVSIDTWLVVIPQIIARIHSPSLPVRSLIHALLVRVGRYHPQALMYPLLVACKSQSAARRGAAMAVVENLQQHSPVLVEQAQLVSQELIRMAILWHEMWHEALEEASRLYFGEHNVQGMLDTLAPLHAMMETVGPETLKEIAFVQQYGRELQEAHEWCVKFKLSGKEAELNQAWDLYYNVFKRINKQLPSLTTLDLLYVSPRLAQAQGLELAVPGTYHAGSTLVTIHSFAPQLLVITSKQRPRKFTIHGGDGNEYVFLLKGHEDLRQDERVMQLFGLVNTLLANHRDTAERDLSIQRYAVVPLSPNSGLIGWVPHCDTLHALIREYRDARKITLNVEHRMMTVFAPDYDHLMLIAKVEVFEHALDSTEGKDIHKVLWLKSRSSEVWLSRRTNYTRSLAVMSMVGYLLGLGDRHPSNLMLDRFSGKILHIDFGDCFEASMNRDKFPEKVPFRLTRMLVKAMEVSGIEGNFRTTCESVMHVLRANKDSVMAMLEAFVHDPLINWRLLTTTEADATTVINAAARSVAHHPHVGGPEDPAVAGVAPGAPGAAPPGPGNLPNMSPPQRMVRERELLQAVGQLGDANEVLNERAVAVMRRMSHKLTGRDFPGQAHLSEPLDKEGPRISVEAQVQALIKMATLAENLCQAYIGWCPFW
eukprot:jgi/Mesvir1/5915/Mv00684-RA.1